jgi:leader peptidase (prepilin peptidase)/N-methyltransferase
LPGRYFLPRREFSKWRSEAENILEVPEAQRAPIGSETFSLSRKELAIVWVGVAIILVAVSFLKTTTTEAWTSGLLLLALLAAWLINRKHFVLLDQIIVPLTWLALAFHAVTKTDPSSYILGAVAGYCGLYIVCFLVKWKTGKVTVGNGDMKTMALLGAVFGVGDVATMYVALFALTIVGAIVRSVREQDGPQPTGLYYFVIAVVLTFWAPSWY